MKRSAIALLFCSGILSSLAQASEEDEWARALEIPCHPLITQVECRGHHERLASLPDGAEREAYLAKYFALLEERVKSCGCSMARNGVGVLRYR
jgi:hypothetical protein